MLEFVATNARWDGELINGVRHPRDIEQKWTQAELAAIGLQKRLISEPPPPQLDVVKSKIKRLLDADAEIHRQKYITPGDGKMLSYREGYEEAVEILADTDAALALVSQPSTDPAFANACEEAYPVSYPDIGKGGTSSIVELAALVASKFEEFQKVENQIKKTVNATSAAIDAAGTVDAAQAAYDAANWTV